MCICDIVRQKGNAFFHKVLIVVPLFYHFKYIKKYMEEVMCKHAHISYHRVNITTLADASH
jgi:hypothetical protein